MIKVAFEYSKWRSAIIFANHGGEAITLSFEVHKFKVKDIWYHAKQTVAKRYISTPDEP